MKNNLSYYRHEVGSHNHWKFKTLRRKFGWGGEGKFWALNNMIAEADGCRLDISNSDRQTAIAVDLDFDPSEFVLYLEYLTNVCKLIVDVDHFLTTGITQENLVDVNEKRERQRNWKKEKSTKKNEESTQTLEKSTTKNVKSTVEKQQSKVNKSKVNKKREYTRALENSNLFREPIIPTLEKVEQVFMGNGGNSEMAKRFFEKYDSVGWYDRGSPIVNFSSKVYSFIENWNKNEKNGNGTDLTKLGTSEARIAKLKTW